MKEEIAEDQKERQSDIAKSMRMTISVAVAVVVIVVAVIVLLAVDLRAGGSIEKPMI